MAYMLGNLNLSLAKRRPLHAMVGTVINKLQQLAHDRYPAEIHDPVSHVLHSVTVNVKFDGGVRALRVDGLSRAENGRLGCIGVVELPW